MVIRRRLQGDIASCIEALAATHASDGYPARWPADPAAWLTPTRMLAAWVLDWQGTVSGHIAIRGASGDSSAALWSTACDRSPDSLAEVTRLFVIQDARGHGYGAALLAEACGEARARGLRPVLKVLDHDRAAMALYDRMGWRRIASVRMPWKTDEASRALLHHYLAPE